MRFLSKFHIPQEWNGKLTPSIADGTPSIKSINSKYIESSHGFFARGHILAVKLASLKVVQGIFSLTLQLYQQSKPFVIASSMQQSILSPALGICNSVSVQLYIAGGPWLLAQVLQGWTTVSILLQDCWSMNQYSAMKFGQPLLPKGDVGLFSHVLQFAFTRKKGMEARRN